MPIQHINDEMLQSMRRHTTGGDIRAIITKLRDKIPGIHIRTSLIVGFPGETEAQFQELNQFVKDFPLNHIGIFKYSREEGTPAGKMETQIAEEVKEKRLEKLSKTQLKVVEKLNQSMVGKTLEVIVEGYHPESNLLMVARHSGQCPDIDGQVILNENDKVNAFGERYQVEITGTMGYDLVGRVIKRMKQKLNLL